MVHFLAQGLGPSKCFWCDQLCTDQASGYGKELAIGAMDLLYNVPTKLSWLWRYWITKEEMDVLVDDDPYRCGNRTRQESDIIASAFGRII